MKNTSLILILFILILTCLTSRRENFTGYSYLSNFNDLVSSLFNRSPKETNEFESVGGVQEIKVGNMVVGQKRWYKDEDGNIGEFNYSPSPMASMWAETPLLSAHHMSDYNPQFVRPVDHSPSLSYYDNPSLYNVVPAPKPAPKPKTFDQVSYHDHILRQVVPNRTPSSSSGGSWNSHLNNLQQQIQDALNNPKVQNALVKYKARQN